MQHHKAGHLEEAQRVFQLGNALAAQGRIDQAVAHYERVLALKPDNVAAHNNLGLMLMAQGKMDQAVAHYERALALNPDDAPTHYNLGLARAAQGKVDQEIAHYQRAVALQPNFAAAHNNLGFTLTAYGKMDQAVAHYERALALKPDYALAHNNLGLTLTAQGKIDQALTHYERALALKPDYAEAHSNLLLTLNYASDKDPVAMYTAHLGFAKRWEASLATSVSAPAKDRSLERRLRIGYVSSDFRQHSIVRFIEPVLAHHDRDRFEVFCYFNNYFQEDEVTVRLKSHADHWRSINGLSDELTAQQIRADQIDILIDLNGHTAKNRLLVFTLRPAPVQVTWLGYPNTTGLSAMNYRITDQFADPVGMTEHLHSEKLIRLPDCFSCYQPYMDAPEVSGLPARAKGYVTFGSFNSLAKITPAVMAVWAQILQAVPGSRLTLKYSGLGEKGTQQTVREVFGTWGIAPERLELLGRDRSTKAHLERYGSVDIGLDPFPYNGATTTCEALWMGVPVVTLAGKTHAGRVGASQISNLGLTEFMCHTPEEYVTTAARLANDLERLSTLREELRSRMAASPLTDTQRFTKNLEQAYLVMWKD